MLVAGGLAGDDAAAVAQLEASLTSGRAAETFARMVSALGGPADLVEHRARHLAPAPVVREVRAAGTVARIATREIGLAVIGLGGGRTRPEDGIDGRVGFSHLAQPGEASGLLGIVHAADTAAADRAEAALRAAYLLGEAPVRGSTVIARIV